jgi:transposase-like protein
MCHIDSPSIILNLGYRYIIKSHREKIYNVEVSPDLISRVANAVMDEVKEWENRQLEKSYAIVYLDARRVKSKQDGKSCTKSVYVALGVNFEVKKEVLGALDCREAPNSGSSTEQRSCEGSPLDGGAERAEEPGAEDMLIACMDGLSGFPEAVRAVYPDTRVQLCMRTKAQFNMVRNSTEFVFWKDLKKVCADLKAIYSAATEEADRDALEEFGKTWNAKYPMMRTFSPIPCLGHSLE